VQTPYSPLLAGRLLHLVDEKTAVIGSFHVLPYTRTIAFVNRLLAMLNRRTAKRFDIMLANTEPTRSFAEHVYGFDARIVPNPFPYKSFVVEPPETTGAARIVFLGRLVPRKGAQALLRAIAYLRREHLSTAPFKVIIGGKGPERESLESYVQQQGLGDIVTFAGFVAEIDKADFLAAADIAVFPSIAGESFGISLLEAMAAARGVVLGGDNPGYRAVLAPLSEAQLILPDDETAFATALAHWLDEPKLRAAAAQAQKAYVRQFDIEVVGKQLIETYDEALRSRRNVR
jgi:phosphatidylinositol alpha-mannosyltransferase